MKKYRNFKCDSGHITERRVEDNITVVACDECQCEARRIISAPRCFQNTVGRSPSSK